MIADPTIRRPEPVALPADAGEAKDDASWLALIDAIGEEAGYFQTVGPSHWAYFADEGTTLLVTFDTVTGARARPGQMPQGATLARSKGWSHLCILADGDTWYRDRAVYAFFDRLVDDAFFEDFDRVVFYGAGMAGYAAAAYSVAAPGSTLLTLCPRATLDPDVAGWDKRDVWARKFDFRSRYGYAPDMTDAAGKAFVLYDPTVAEDAMHAALYRARHVNRLALPRAGGRLETTLSQMGILDDLILAAAEDRLTTAEVFSQWRKRRSYGPYLRALLETAAAAGRTGHEAMICRSVTRRLRAPRFHKRLKELTGQA